MSPTGMAGAAACLGHSGWTTVAPQRVDGVEAVTQVPKPPWRPVPRGSGDEGRVGLGAVDREGGRVAVRVVVEVEGHLDAAAARAAEGDEGVQSGREAARDEAAGARLPGYPDQPVGARVADRRRAQLPRHGAGRRRRGVRCAGGRLERHVQLKGSGDGAYLRVGSSNPESGSCRIPGAVLDPSGREVRGAQGCADPKKDAFGCFATSNLHIEVDYRRRPLLDLPVDRDRDLPRALRAAGRNPTRRGSGPGAPGDGPEPASLVQVTRADGPGRAGLGRTGQLCSKRAQFTGAGVW